MVWLRTKNRTILQEGNFKAELPESSVINLIGLHLFLNQVIDKADGFFQAVGKGMNFGSFSGAEKQGNVCFAKFLFETAAFVIFETAFTKFDTLYNLQKKKA